MFVEQVLHIMLDQDNPRSLCFFHLQRYIFFETNKCFCTYFICCLFLKAYSNSSVCSYKQNGRT